MAVTYRVIERYASRRKYIETVRAETTGRLLKLVFSGLLDRFCYCQLAKLLRNTISKLVYSIDSIWIIIYLLITKVIRWMVQRLLAFYHLKRYKSLVMVTFDSGSCWITSVYFVPVTDNCRGNYSSIVDEIRQTIITSDDNDFKLFRRKTGVFGLVQLWTKDRCTTKEQLESSVEEVSPVWNHQIVTEDTMHDYVSELCSRSLISDDTTLPWRIYLIPLPVSASCCLVIQSHPVVVRGIDSIIRRVIRWTASANNIHRVLADDHSRSGGGSGSGQSMATRLSWSKRIQLDVIERMCERTGASIQQTIMAAFIQSLYDSFKHSSCVLLLDLRVEIRSGPPTATATTIRSVCIRSSSEVDDGRLVLDQLVSGRRHHHRHQQSNLCKELVDRKHFGCSRIALATVVLETVIDESTQSQSATGCCCLLQWPPLSQDSDMHLCLWVGRSWLRLGVAHHHQLLDFAVREGVERRVHQLASVLGVQSRKLSPHSTPSTTPVRHCSTPPPHNDHK